MGFRANIQIYSDFQEFTNQYPNIFGCLKIYDQISKYIRTGERAQIQIQIILWGNFILIFECLNICVHHCASLY